MRIALPIWQDKVSPLFDTASRLLIVETKNKTEVFRFETYLDEVDISRRSQRIQNIGLDVLICGALSRPFAMMLKAGGIDLIAGISGQIEEVLQVFLHNRHFLSQYLMPGYDMDYTIQAGEFANTKKLMLLKYLLNSNYHKIIQILLILVLL